MSAIPPRPDVVAHVGMSAKCQKAGIGATRCTLTLRDSDLGRGGNQHEPQNGFYDRDWSKADGHSPSAAPISEPADIAETIRLAPSLVSIAPDRQ